MAPVIAKSLSKLSRDSLIDLCLKWTDSSTSTPYLTSNRKLHESDEEDYLHEPAESTSKLRNLYNNLRGQENIRTKCSKREIIDRIIDGDWRRGLSLQQLADIDFANLEQNDTALRWSALKLVPMTATTDPSTQPSKKRKISTPPQHQHHCPTLSPSLFLTNLKAHVSPLVKAHYTLHRLPEPSKLVVLRLYIIPHAAFAPLSSNIPRDVRQATDSGRVMYIALPDSCAYVYVSLAGSEGSVAQATGTKIDIAATKRIVLQSIPKAFSKPQERWSLENTKLTCRSLRAIGLLRGNGRPGTAGGCYSKFSEEYEWISPRPVNRGADSEKVKTDTGSQAESTPLTIVWRGKRKRGQEDIVSERAVAVETRFGNMTQPSHAKLDRFHVSINDIRATPTTSKSPAPPVSKESRPKRKRLSMEEIEAGRGQPDEQGIRSDSVAQTTPNIKEPAPITLTFSGTDVFQGLKELALVDGGRYVDLDRLPSWMTGERGVSGLVV